MRKKFQIIDNITTEALKIIDNITTEALKISSKPIISVLKT